MFDRENLHHAYLLLGERQSVRQWLFAELESLGISTRGNPDFFLHEPELFGVDDARLLGARAQERGFLGTKVFVLVPERITPEAQNALLKTFEEPVPDTHFFLISREEATILPTLRSRMQAIQARELPLTDSSDVSSGKHGQNLFEKARSPEAFSTETQSALSFLQSSPAERLKFVKKFVDEEKNLSEFLDDLLRSMRDLSAPVENIEKVYATRRYASDRSAATRLVLEHLALVI